MFRNFLVVLITLTLLLTNVSKAMGLNVHDCELMVETATLVEEHASHAQMSHTQMPHESMSHDSGHVMSGEKADCCKSDCSCPNNICSSTSYLTSTRTNQSIGFCIDKISTTSAELSAEFQKSLYRPPIIA